MNSGIEDQLSIKNYTDASSKTYDVRGLMEISAILFLTLKYTDFCIYKSRNKLKFYSPIYWYPKIFYSHRYEDIRGMHLDVPLYQVSFVPSVPHGIDIKSIYFMHQLFVESSSTGSDIILYIYDFSTHHHFSRLYRQEILLISKQETKLVDEY